MSHHQRIIVLDIETAPTTNTRIISAIQEGIKPPGTHKKPETIAKWYQEEAPAATAEKVARTALDGMRGRLIAIGLQQVVIPQDYADAVIDEPLILVRTQEQSDNDFVQEAFAALSHSFGDPPELPWQSEERSVRVAGHNLIGFDLPFLWQQAVRHGEPWPRFLPVLPGPYDRTVLDTMLALVGNRNTISLHDACMSIGIPYDEGACSSADVPILWESGDHEEVVKHLRNDVLTTTALAMSIMSATLETSDAPL